MEENKTKKTTKKRSLVKPHIFHEFVLWMSIFEGVREPKTQEEFSKKFKVSQWTLSQWKKREDFWKQVEEEWKTWGREKTTNVVNKLYSKIMKEGESSNFKLWFQYFLDWAEKQETKVKFAELDKIMEFTKQILEKKYDEPTGAKGDQGAGEVKVQDQGGVTV